MPTSDPAFLAEIRKLPCLACGRHPPSEAHHVKSRRTIGDDGHNIIPLCGEHHRGRWGWHGGRWTFLQNFPHVAKHLRALGWTIDIENRVLHHPLNEL